METKLNWKLNRLHKAINTSRGISLLKKQLLRLLMRLSVKMKKWRLMRIRIRPSRQILSQSWWRHLSRRWPRARISLMKLQRCWDHTSNNGRAWKEMSDSKKRSACTYALLITLTIRTKAREFVSILHMLELSFFPQWPGDCSWKGLSIVPETWMNKDFPRAAMALFLVLVIVQNLVLWGRCWGRLMDAIANRAYTSTCWAYSTISIKLVLIS